MDFKIEEIDEEEKSKKSSNNNLMPIIIVVIIALIVGLLVFLVSNKAFGKKEKKPEPVTETKLKLTEDNVEILYAYVTYGTKNIRNEKFIKEKNVDINSFTNDEKFYYALQFAQVEDFENDGELDKDNKFIWPDNDNNSNHEYGTCLGTRNHIAILVDGTVIPCCLDSKGLLKLGNIFETDLEKILDSSLFKNINNGFKNNKLTYNLCRNCIFRQQKFK